MKDSNLTTLQSNDIDKYNLKFYITFSVWVTAFIIAGALTGFYYFIEEETKRDVFNFGTTAFGVSIASASAVHVYRDLKKTAERQDREIKAQRYEERLNRTISYISRWNSPEYSAIRSTIGKTLKEIDNNELVRHLKANPKESQDFVTILNFLEEVSYLICKGFVEEKILKEFYHGIIRTTYLKLFLFIDSRRREADNEKLYVYLETLYDAWKTNGKN